MKRTWRLYLDPEPRRGSWNMAADEFLLSLLPDEPETVLRFYAWDRPTASLGCSQEADKVVDKDFCLKNGVAVVRRMTGGKMVLHDRELTYALASSDTGLFKETVRESYRLVSAALAMGLAELGLVAEPAGAPSEDYVRGSLPCFSRPGRDELQVGGKKILGSAQKRLGGKFLQHGSLPLAHDEGLLRSVSRAREEVDIRMTSLSALLGRTVSWEEAAVCLRRGFGAYFQADLIPVRFSSEEEERIRQLEIRKYAADVWTFLGRSPEQRS